MIALTGALCFSALCFVLPGAFYLRLEPPGTPCPMYEKAVAMMLIALGVVGAIIGVQGAIVRE